MLLYIQIFIVIIRKSVSKAYDEISEMDYQSKSHKHVKWKPDFPRFPSESLLLQKQQTKIMTDKQTGGQTN